MTDIVIDTRKLDQITAQLGYNADQVVKWLAFQVEAGAKMRAPVDTSALRNSLHTEQQEEAWYRVSDGVDYGIYQELGFRHHGSGRFIHNPFMVPAAEEIRDDINSGRTWERLFR
jgi:hypothetical protein